MGLIAMMENTNVIVYYQLSIKLKIEVVAGVKLKNAVLVKISNFRTHSVSSSIAIFVYHLISTYIKIKVVDVEQLKKTR